MPETDDLTVRSGRFRTTRFPGVQGGGFSTTGNAVAPVTSFAPTSAPAPRPTGFRDTSLVDDGDPEATPANEPGGFTGTLTGQQLSLGLGLLGLAVPAAAPVAAFLGKGIGFANTVNNLFSEDEVGTPGSATPSHSLGQDPDTPGQGDDTGPDGPGDTGGGNGGSGGSGPGGSPGADGGDDTGPGEGDDGGADGADGGPCFISAALNDMGDWSDSRKRLAVNWCRQTHHDGSTRGDMWLSGYHLWGCLTAQLMRRSRLLRRTIRPMIDAFIGQVTGKRRTVFGFAVKWLLFDALSYGIGAVSHLLKSRKERNHAVE